jgi:Zn-dependent protease with chaperone function
MQPGTTGDDGPLQAATAAIVGQRGRLFDGRSTDGQAAWAWIEGSDLAVESPVRTPGGTEAADPAGAVSEADGASDRPQVAPERRCVRYPLRALALGDRWRSGPYPVGLPDGGTLWVDGDDPGSAGFVDALLRGAGRRPGAQRLWRSWPAALACLALLLAVLVWIDRQGAGLAARAVLPLVPLKIDENVGKQLMKNLDADYFVASSRGADIDGLRRRFHEMAQACGQGRSYTLEVRRLRDSSGFNALALPDGTLVMLDGMLDVLSEEEALAVLGHEIGHVAHRHGMGHLLKAMGLLAVAGVVLSDFSSVLATTVSVIQFRSHSRAAEREADAHARECLARVGIDPRVMVGLWMKFRAERDRRGGVEPPAWLSSHPGLEERLRAAQQP